MQDNGGAEKNGQHEDAHLRVRVCVRARIIQTQETRARTITHTDVHSCTHTHTQHKDAHLRGLKRPRNHGDVVENKVGQRRVFFHIGHAVVDEGHDPSTRKNNAPAEHERETQPQHG